MIFYKTMITFEEGEYVIHVVHKHWFIFAIRFFVMLIIALLPLIILPFLTYVSGMVKEDIFAYFSFVYIIFLLFIWITSFLIWTDYYLDMSIITNKRIMDVEQKGLFSREISTMRYEMIQDITADVEGVIPTLLNYGNVYVQTAATTREFNLTQIANPGHVKEIISHEMARVVDHHHL